MTDMIANWIAYRRIMRYAAQRERDELLELRRREVEALERAADKGSQRP